MNCGVLAFVVLAISCVNASTADPRRGFECSVDIADTTQAQRVSISSILPPNEVVDDPVQLNESVGALRREGFSNSTIISHLIGSYCPLVARNTSMSDIQKAWAVRKFETKVTLLVYDYGNADMVILDVPLKPALVDEIHFAAERQGDSVEGWVARVVQAAIQRNGSN